MAYRTEIDRALDEAVSDEGNSFQTIAVNRAQHIRSTKVRVG
jgi:hypothetical protein